ncbi:MAG: ABC-2 type transport system ATP-binding protein [Polaribacter sp.]|jgi:ABC-2 type transport system ATP-binding protein
MSVKVENLTKIYGTQRAVDNISFEARKGQVLGFLGPNGAGKTTTMKILTCFIPQTEGHATVGGHDVTKDPIAARRAIGYLPEHNPLYKDMYVKEYLRFVAGLYKLQNKNNRVADMIERTGLGIEQNKLIGALSKGYRQRVGLAQAMLHDPEVLILDEPTSGLDPNQLVEIRGLIKSFGEEKTVIFSTHIMQEVQALCDRVLIINKGILVADDPIENLQQLVKGESVVQVEFQQSVSAAKLEQISGVIAVSSVGQNQWKITAEANADIRPEIFRFAVKENLVLLGMNKNEFSVEDVFQQLTTK